LYVPIHNRPCWSTSSVRIQMPGSAGSASGLKVVKRMPSKRARPDCVPTQM
jgi:hypothetical protein